jgi:hypothetical protein
MRVVSRYGGDRGGAGGDVRGASPHLDERQRRLLAGAQARALGRGGIAMVTRASGLSRATVKAGTTEIDHRPERTGRIRRPGAGRPRVTRHDPDLLQALDGLVEPTARGDPMSPLTAGPIRPESG